MNEYENSISFIRDAYVILPQQVAMYSSVFYTFF